MLVTALSTVYQWFPLGIHLDLSYFDLKMIEANEMRQVEMCKINMLAMWLKGPEEKRSKQFLQDALKQLTQSPQLVSSLPPNTSATGEYRECVYDGITCDSVLQHNRPVIACYHPPPPSLDSHHCLLLQTNQVRNEIVCNGASCDSFVQQK